MTVAASVRPLGIRHAHRPRFPAAVARLREPLRELAAPAITAARAVARVVTPLGRGVVAAAAGAWLLGWRLGWLELSMAAAACIVGLALSVPFVVRPSVVSGVIELASDRVFVGARVAGRVVVTNESKRRLLPMRIDLPVGGAGAPFGIPSLGNGQRHAEEFILPTHRRAVVTIGPVTSVTGDPLGLLRRDRTASPSVELFVHPLVNHLPSLGSGLLRDLEGQTTKDLSASDLAFHTLRDYVPGDDRRYIHWRSSAKAGRKLVRQFLDTRRSRVTIAVDADEQSYRDDDEFELAMSVVASLGVRCLKDDLDLTVVAGGHATTPAQPTALLDTLSRVTPGDARRGLAAASHRAADMATDTSYAVLVTGSVIPFGDLHGAVRWFGPDVIPLAVRVERDVPAGLSVSGGMTVIAISDRADLPGLLAWSAK